jgi:hypothetical protein
MCLYHGIGLICDCIRKSGEVMMDLTTMDYITMFVDFFGDTQGPAAKKRALELLNWWSM